MESKNPAIKAAAQIKKDQDLAPQKIKAIKYLGTIACCCPTNKDDVKNALLAALDDCTDEVRQAAATAICQASGDPCTICNQCSCCTADVMNKLNEMANEQDEKGCWKEPNPVVRQAASLALEACRRVRGPEPAAEAPPPVKEEQKERRVPTAPKDPAYSTPPSQPAPSKDAPKPSAKPAAKPATKSADAPASEGEGWKVRPASAESPAAGFAVIADPTSKPAASPKAESKPAQKAEAKPVEKKAEAKPVEKKVETSPKPVQQKPAPAVAPEPKPLSSEKSGEPKLLIKFSAAD
jgi:hypothetical protein